MNRVQIQGKLCGFSHGFQEDGLLRQSMNQLTQAVYRFDFEDWHQSGRWKPEDCCPYALFEGEQAVSLLTANLIPFCWQGKPQRLLQLGTVCTLLEYRGRGLSRFLIEQVLRDWENRCGMIYLFANDSVLEFYPKFGFEPAKEFHAVRPIPQADGPACRRLHPENSSDFQLISEHAASAFPQFQLSMQASWLAEFYARYFPPAGMGNSFYYFPELDAVACAKAEGDTLLFYDLFAPNPVPILSLLPGLCTALEAKHPIRQVDCQVFPEDLTGWEIRLFREGDRTLFLKGPLAENWKKHPLIFPLLSLGPV